jgi:hypothetical protein
VESPTLNNQREHSVKKFGENQIKNPSEGPQRLNDGVNHVKKSQSADFTLQGGPCAGTPKDPCLDPEKTQWRIPLKNKFADQQLKQSPAVEQYKIIQAGTLVKSSIEMLSFLVC